MNPIQFIFIALAVVMLPHLSVQQCSWNYSVKAGDTCWNIMNYHGIASSTFYGLNPALDCNALQIGKSICLQGAPGAPAAPGAANGCSKTYAVQSGDYCYLIWNKFGLTETEFFSLNQGIICEKLSPGQQVVVKSSC